MQRIRICALKKNRKHILELLQREGMIEVCDIIHEDDTFHKMDVSLPADLLRKGTSLAKDAIDILDKYNPENKSGSNMLKGRKEVSTSVYDSFAKKRDSVMKKCNRIVQLDKIIAESKAEITKLNTQSEILQPWLNLDIPIDFKGTKYTRSFVGTLPNLWKLDEIYQELAEEMPLNVDIISSSKEQTCIFVLCIKDKQEAVSDKLRSIGFSYPGLTDAKNPSQKMEQLQSEIQKNQKTIEDCMNELKDLGSIREDICFLQDYESMRLEKYNVLGRLLQTSKVFILTGYIPKKEANNLESKLNQRFELSVEFEDPDESEDTPVLLENNGFSRPIQDTIEGFSPPGKYEIDPTMITSLFYYVLYGLMLSDAGYGLIITSACGLLLVKFRTTIEETTKNFLKMFLFCGISTIFWGIVFGSYFGDMVDVVSNTFFGEKITIQPLWFFPVKKPMQMLLFSMALGIVHLFTGLGMKCYQCLRQKDYKAILYDVLLWYVLLGSSVVYLLTMKMFVDIVGLTFILPASVAKVSGVLAMISALGIILTNGRESKNPFKRILKGLYALYGITGYLSDVLSYSRLLALGLATGVICTVINKMAAMAAVGAIGPIIFIIIVLLGHTLNIGINALGAYVHTTRLQYVEFFGKFYEGGGRKFEPFDTNTKYYKFKEKMENG
ncbi:V-type ATP synthase subunit I [Anaerosacchariphilus polymeriproducens]|uniref:V-type ATP synthase subunit I n=2 Tax=Anaerosacchariphilus polymeriproducens TaxID=1812858 RepID=A0A371AR60_9FIRM|nr:V-type ATP synthase subunit I [Anaerosacchariphilus polymeriproducens]